MVGDNKSCESLFKQVRVLIVEDDAVNQMVAQRLLLKEGFDKENITIVPNGLGAVDSYNRSPYHLILMDIQMPIMDGIETAKQIRQIEKQQQLDPCVIIALTANSASLDRGRYLAQGMNDCISKPLNPGVFRMQIGRWVIGHCHVNDEQETLPAASDSNSPINWQILNELSAEDEQLMKMLVSEYLKSAPGVVFLVKEAINNEDSFKLQTSAHKLKGSSMAIGSTSFAQVCKQLEDYGKHENPGAAKKLLNNFENEWNQLKEILTKIANDTSYRIGKGRAA